jgi:hypothetical protein
MATCQISNMPKNDKPDPLLASLANLKPRPDTPAREVISPVAEQISSPALPPKKKAPPVDKLAPSFSISVYDSDFDRMEKVRRWLTAQGVRSANKSELLRLGLRFAAESEANSAALAKIFREMKEQDGRKKPA